jgi:hypothetical protein
MAGVVRKRHEQQGSDSGKHNRLANLKLMRVGQK